MIFWFFDIYGREKMAETMAGGATLFLKIQLKFGKNLENFSKIVEKSISVIFEFSIFLVIFKMISNN
jgi:hypothetical protein